MELARFWKYAQRMRGLSKHGPLEVLPLEVFLALQCWAINETLFPNLKTLNLWCVTGELTQFIPLFLSPCTTIISIKESNLPLATTALMIPTLLGICPNLQKIVLHPLLRDPMLSSVVVGVALVS